MRRSHQQRLQGEQLDIRFPRRGRPTRIRVLERCGQLRLNLCGAAKTERVVHFVQLVRNEESLDAALDLCFPERELTEPERMRELNRLFQSTAITPENPITDADVPF